MLLNGRPGLRRGGMTQTIVLERSGIKIPLRTALSFNGLTVRKDPALDLVLIPTIPTPTKGGQDIVG